MTPTLAVHLITQVPNFSNYVFNNGHGFSLICYDYYNLTILNNFGNSNYPKLPKYAEFWNRPVFIKRSIAFYSVGSMSHLSMLWLFLTDPWSTTLHLCIRNRPKSIFNASDLYIFWFFGIHPWNKVFLCCKIDLNWNRTLVFYFCIIFYSMHSFFALPGWRQAYIWKKDRVSQLGLVFRWNTQ